MKKYLSYLKNSKKLKGLIDKASTLIKEGKVKDKLKKSISKIELLLSMLKSHYKGEFKIKKRAFLYIVMAIVYLINPLDAIPDVLLWGFIDDLTVIGWVYSRIDSEVVRYNDFLNKKDETRKGEQSSFLDQKGKNSDS